jgi:oxaloacetate decarboxylase alpha subunit
VLDRIDSLSRTRELRRAADMPPLDELRRRIGPELCDEEFLLRATMPAGQVDAMLAAPPANRLYDPSTRPIMHLIRQLTARRDLDRISVRKPGFSLELRRSPRCRR